MNNERKNSVDSANKGTNEIIRVKRLPNNFVQMHKGFLEDASLSFKAKGILGYLLTKPDNWTVRISDLMNHAKDGRDSIYAGLKELQDRKYYHKVQARDAKGRLSHWECFICEVPMSNDTDFSTVPPLTKKPFTEKPDTAMPCMDNPLTETPYAENPNTAKPYMENPPHSNINITNNDFNKNEHSNTDCSNNKPLTPTPPAEDNHGEAASVRGDNKTKPGAVSSITTMPNISKPEYLASKSNTPSLSA